MHFKNMYFKRGNVTKDRFLYLKNFNSLLKIYTKNFDQDIIYLLF